MHIQMTNIRSAIGYRSPVYRVNRVDLTLVHPRWQSARPEARRIRSPIAVIFCEFILVRSIEHFVVLKCVETMAEQQKVDNVLQRT